jgi:hypothetical protein
MLETLFIWGFVVLPLAVAVVLIAYRVRVFVIGIILISLTAAAGWVAISAVGSLEGWLHAREAGRGTPACADPGASKAERCAL